MCSAVCHYPTVSFEEPLTASWFRITALLANSLSIRLQHPFSKLCLFSIFFPLFASQVWLNYVLKDVLWQTASPREVHFIHLWKWAAMWTAVKWLIFLSSTTQPPPQDDLLGKMRELGCHGGKRNVVLKWYTAFIRIVNYRGYCTNLYTMCVQME